MNPLDGGIFAEATECILADPAAFSLQNMSNIVLAAGILQQPLEQAVIETVCTTLQIFLPVLYTTIAASCSQIQPKISCLILTYCISNTQAMHSFMHRFYEHR